MYYSSDHTPDFPTDLRTKQNKGHVTLHLQCTPRLIPIRLFTHISLVSGSSESIVARSAYMRDPRSDRLGNPRKWVDGALN